MKTLTEYISESKSKGDAKKIAKDIVSEYFGGYLPKNLEEEGMSCKNDEELYSLIEKIETYYRNEHPEDNKYTEDDLDFVHQEITELVKKLNK